VAQAVATAAQDEVGDPAPVDDFLSTAGLGVRGRVGGRLVVAGRAEHLEAEGFVLPADLAAARDEAADRGHTTVLAGWDGEVRAVLVVADTVKATSAAAVAELRELGLTPVLLTGDNERTARTVADEVGIDEVAAGVLPEGKVDVIRR